MKTTLNFPDALILEAKIIAAREHTTLTGLIVEGLKMRLRQRDVPRELPVSASGGGLMDGHTWEGIRRSVAGNEVYR
ncbi:MAG: DUF2191 domain-containing protein [Spirochaetota bacterium]|nr:DUF2191 domain-containing protein [Spirochaetota bacterium]